MKGNPSSRVIRAVFDANVVVSALLFPRSEVSWLRPGWASRRIVPIAHRDTVAELVRVLAYPKFRLSVTDREEFLGDFLPYAEHHHDPLRLGGLTCDDPDDLPFVALAIASNADYLVTGDSHIRAIAQSLPVMVVTPAILRTRTDR